MIYHQMMRTTLDIAPDVMAAAKELARLQHKTAGEVLSDLARKSLTASVPDTARQVRNGFVQLPQIPGRIVTSDFVGQIEAEIEREDFADAVAPRR